MDEAPGLTISQTSSLWLSPEVLGWVALPGGITPLGDEWRRTHAIWSNAEEILAESVTVPYLVDAIATLKRSIDQRLSHLKRLYFLESIPGHRQPRRMLEILEYWGIIRPTLLRKLIEIRNAVEHEDATPPDQERCLEFLDFVWYFLRSTDSLCSSVRDEINLYAPDHRYEIGLTTGPHSDWHIQIQGWSPPSLVSVNDHLDWMYLRAERVESVEDLIQRFPGTTREEREPGDLWLVGEIVGGEEQIERVYKLYFSYPIEF